MPSEDVEKLGSLIQEGNADGVRSFLATCTPANRGFQHYDFAEGTREYDTFATLAVKAHSLAIVELLMENDYDFVEGDVSDNAPLLLAYKQRDIAIVHAIIRYAVKIGNMDVLNVKNSQNATAMILAAREGDLDTIRLLVNAGADKSCVSEGETAFQVATRFDHLEIARFLQQ